MEDRNDRRGGGSAMITDMATFTNRCEIFIW